MRNLTPLEGKSWNTPLAKRQEKKGEFETEKHPQLTQWYAIFMPAFLWILFFYAI